MGNVLLTKALDTPTLGMLMAGLEILIAILVIALIVLINKLSSGNTAAAPAPVAVSASLAAPAAPTAVAPAVAPAVPIFKTNLHNVSDRDAAMIMAIVADEMQAPLNELQFISIKEVE